MENFKIDSYYFNEHTLELELYKGDAIYITLCYDKHPNNMEIKEVIEDIEKEQNEFYQLLNN
jgi:hypothetical protein